MIVRPLKKMTSVSFSVCNFGLLESLFTVSVLDEKPNKSVDGLYPSAVITPEKYFG